MKALEILRETVDRTAIIHPTLDLNLLHAALGVTGEAGEFADLVKKITIYKSKDFYDPKVRDSLLFELGDAAWYIDLAIKIIGSSWEEVIEMNREKLALRFKDKFTVDEVNVKADKKITGELE